MNARIIARWVLRQDAGLIALVPVARIYAGNIPSGAASPAVGLNIVSSSEHQPVSGGRSAKVTSRIQATIRAKDTQSLDAVMKQLRLAARNFVGAVPGVPGVTSVTLLDEGPDFEAEGNFIIQTQDLRVIWTDAG